MSKSFTRIGVNCISPAALPLVRTLINQGEADFCELMVDNFIHLSPALIKTALPDVPVALHIVSSRFLEKSVSELETMARCLRVWIMELQPLYVSDHLVQFSASGRRLSMVRELDYANQYDAVKARVQQWQTLLGVRLLLENHASLTIAGVQQAAFFERLLNETGAGLLFDISNAYIAELNGVSSFAQWLTLMDQTPYFHVAGFRRDVASGLALDTHDRPIDDVVLAKMLMYLRQRQQINIVVECDASATLDAWHAEIQRVRQTLAVPANVHVLEREALYQRLFGRAPQTLALSAAHGNDMVDPFAAWADKSGLSFGWSLSLHFLDWLCQCDEWAAQITDDIKKELMLAAAVQWSLAGMDTPTAQGMLLASAHLPGCAVGIWKAACADKAGKTVILAVSPSFMVSGNQYAVSYQQGSWEGIEWVVVPP